VVVKPETASNTASVSVRSGLSEISKGTAPARPSTIQNMDTIKKPSRTRSSRIALRAGHQMSAPTSNIPMNESRNGCQ
jgi:hypothetical protein